MITGKVRAWPKGSEYSNQFVQIHITLNKELFLFNGYMKEGEISQFNVLMASHWDGVQLVNMKIKDPRKMAKDEVDGWAKSKGVTVYRHPVVYLTQLKMELLTHNKKNNKSSLSNEDGEQEI